MLGLDDPSSVVEVLRAERCVESSGNVSTFDVVMAIPNRDSGRRCRKRSFWLV